MGVFTDIVRLIYNYCTDFVINLANVLDLSYYEINFIIFCVFYPAILIGSFLFFLFQKFKLRKIRRKASLKN